MSSLQIARKMIGQHRLPRVQPLSLSLLIEAAWALFAFCLFLVLGPFAVVAVIPAVLRLIPSGQVGEPEMLGRDRD